MITVAGGVYVERCLQPVWYQLFGSGGRAGAALAAVSDGVDLHTYVADVWESHLVARAAASGFRVVATRAANTAAFEYVHPLAVPLITPPLSDIARAAPLHVEASVVLRFGFVEGDAIVRGGRVVYDPQSASSPAPYRANGSQAEVLAIVANAHEVRLLTRESDAQAGARSLLASEGAEAVVVKRGVHGALVVTTAGVTEVPAYRTELVFSIGSGDVFAAAFAHAWGELKLGADRAADYASHATARYVETSSAPLVAPAEVPSLGHQPVSFRPGRVYLAAPFFNLAQRWLVEEARLHLRGLGLDVFSPVHDVGVGPAEQVAPADLEGLKSCDRVLALIDGGDVGTIFEVGYARAKGIPVVALAEAVGPEAMKMIEGSGCLVTHDFATAIYLTAWGAR